MSNTCLCINLRSAAQQLTQAYDEAMAPSGISVTQFSQLHLIQTLGTPTLKELADASQLERSTLGRNIKVLERMGLVTTKVGEDARSRTIQVSRRGRDAFKRALPLWSAVQSELSKRLGLKGRQQLEDMLAALTEPLVGKQA